MKEHEYKELSTPMLLSYGYKYMDQPVMKKMLAHIYKHNDVTMTDLALLLRLNQSVCSQYLKKLRHTNLVESKHVGKCKYYNVTDYYLQMKNFIIQIKEYVDTVSSSR